MVAHRPRDANATGRADCLKPGGDVDPITVNIGALRQHVGDIDPNAKANALDGWKVAIEFRNAALHLGRALNRRRDAGEFDEQGIAGGIDDPAALLAQLGIDQIAAKQPNAI